MLTDSRQMRGMEGWRHARGISSGKGGGWGSWADDITLSNTHRRTLETSMRSRCCVTPMKRGGMEGGEGESWMFFGCKRKKERIKGWAKEEKKERKTRERGQNELSVEGLGGTRWETHAVKHTHAHTHAHTHTHTNTHTRPHVPASVGGVWWWPPDTRWRWRWRDDTLPLSSLALSSRSWCIWCDLAASFNWLCHRHLRGILGICVPKEFVREPQPSGPERAVTPQECCVQVTWERR